MSIVKSFFDVLIFLGQYSAKSVLLNLCETERENQLSWIRTEIHHLNTLKQLGNLEALFYFIVVNCYIGVFH
jgi:hypothetical protein